MFFHDKRLQYHAKPERPDPLYAKQLQEVLGGQWGEISVMMMYLFQGWNCRGPAKYRDMLLDIGTEEIAHVEMLATMICRLLEGASPEDQEHAAKSNSVLGAIMGGTSPKDQIMAISGRGRLTRSNFSSAAGARRPTTRSASPGPRATSSPAAT
jgi:Mn-containing catalase